MAESNYGFLGLAKVAASSKGMEMGWERGLWWVVEEEGGCLREEAWRVGRRAQVAYLSVHMD